MKNKLKSIIMLIALLITLSTQVSAQESKEYDLPKIGMKINLNSSMIDLVSAIQNEDEKVSKIENKDKYLENYYYSGILLDAVDNIEDKPAKEIIVAVRTSTSYAEMPDLNQISEEDLNTYKEQLINSIITQSTENTTSYEIKENETIKTENGNTYIKTNATIQTEENHIKIIMYYTVMNGRFITISFRKYDDSIENFNETTLETIQNIEFYEVERPQTMSVASLAAGVVVIAFIIIAIAVIIIRIKDGRLINKNIKDIKFKQYSKFGGPLLVFWTVCMYQVLLRVVDIAETSKIQNMEFYKNCIIIQSTIWALIAMYQIYRTLKRKEDTPKKIKISNYIMLVAGVILTLTRIIYAFIVPNTIFNDEYFKQEISTLILSIVYPLFWNTYFNFSKRVIVYYYLPEKTYKEMWQGTKIYKLIKSSKKVV